METIQKFLEVSDVESKTKEEVNILFSGYFEQVKQWETEAYPLVVRDEFDKEGMKKAAVGRKKVKEMRLQIEKKRKQLKESSLRRGRLIDSIAKELKEAILPIEEHLLKQEKFKENQEKERYEIRKKRREDELSKIIDDYYIYNYANMTEEQYAELLDMIQLKKQKAEEDRRKAEEARIAEEEARRQAKEERKKEWERQEQERIKLEKERRAIEEEKRKAVGQIQAESNRQEKERKRLDAERKKIEQENKKIEQAHKEFEQEKKKIEKAKQEIEQPAEVKEQTNLFYEVEKEVVSEIKLKLTDEDIFYLKKYIYVMQQTNADLINILDNTIPSITLKTEIDHTQKYINDIIEQWREYV